MASLGPARTSLECDEIFDLCRDYEVDGVLASPFMVSHVDGCIGKNCGMVIR
jgi:hypothetical protein